MKEDKDRKNWGFRSSIAIFREQITPATSSVRRQSKLLRLKEEKRERLSPRPRPRARLARRSRRIYTLVHEGEDESLGARERRAALQTEQHAEWNPSSTGADRLGAVHGNVPPGDS